MSTQDIDGFEEIDPAVLSLVASRDYPAWQRRIEAIRACHRPIRLVGRTVVSDATTGEVVEVFDSKGLPFGSLLIPCGNRRASECPPCARLYQADVFHLVRAGMVGGKGVPEAVATHPMVFLTLTAPSFGRVHTRVVEGERVLPCHGGRAGRCEHGVLRSCGACHGPDDPTLGTPLCAECFDYGGAVVWNAKAPALWHQFTDKVRRVGLPYVLGMTARECRDAARVSFTKVAEYQRRGLVHFHAVVRLDGPCGPGERPIEAATTGKLMEALDLALPLAWVSAPRFPRGHCDARFGEQYSAEPIVFDTAAEAATYEMVASYIAKYSTKGAETVGTTARSVACRRCAGSGLMGACPACGGTGLAVPLEELGLSDHALRLMRAAWELGGTRQGDALGLRRWAHQAGFGGHFSTRSRLYSTTMGALRRAREEFKAEHSHRDRLTGELRVQREWELARVGYTPAEEEAVSWVRHWMEHNDTIGREELARLREEEAIMREMAEADPAYWEGRDEP